MYEQEKYFKARAKNKQKDKQQTNSIAKFQQKNKKCVYKLPRQNNDEKINKKIQFIEKNKHTNNVQRVYKFKKPTFMFKNLKQENDISKQTKKQIIKISNQIKNQNQNTIFDISGQKLKTKSKMKQKQKNKTKQNNKINKVLLQTNSIYVQTEISFPSINARLSNKQQQDIFQENKKKSQSIENQYYQQFSINEKKITNKTQLKYLQNTPSTRGSEKSSWIKIKQSHFKSCAITEEDQPWSIQNKALSEIQHKSKLNLTMQVSKRQFVQNSGNGKAQMYSWKANNIFTSIHNQDSHYETYTYIEDNYQNIINKVHSFQIKHLQGSIAFGITGQKTAKSMSSCYRHQKAISMRINEDKTLCIYEHGKMIPRPYFVPSQKRILKIVAFIQASKKTLKFYLNDTKVYQTALKGLRQNQNIQKQQLDPENIVPFVATFGIGCSWQSYR